MESEELGGMIIGGFVLLCVFGGYAVRCSAWGDGCGSCNEEDSSQSSSINATVAVEEKDYILQYTDESGTHQIEVDSGMPYSIDKIPQKTGYEFLGLFDSAVGGTQYVSANGASIAPFKDDTSMVLFPQYKAKEYTVVLDYQGASVSGSRQMKVTYDMEIPPLPTNLTKNYMEFTGWYTEKDGKGVQVADRWGNKSGIAILNENNFDISNENGYINLYAGFEKQTVTVTFRFENGQTEQMEVAYGTSISEIVPDTRNDEGFAVSAWSKSQNGNEVFTDEITYDTFLYAIEWAPCINFNTDGGDYVKPIVAQAGTSITLPTATKDVAKFMHWENTDGTQANLTKMPTSSITLKAVWQGEITFDENGGEEVNDISVEAGQAITLPTPKKDGYLFAGWYTEDRTLYTSTTMPFFGVSLRAGWYKISGQETISLDDYEPSGSANEERRADDLLIDCSSFLDSNYLGQVRITVNMQTQVANGSYKETPYMQLNYYSTETINNLYLLSSIKIDMPENYANVHEAREFSLSGNKIYCSRYCNFDPDYYDYKITNYQVTIEYAASNHIYF